MRNTIATAESNSANQRPQRLDSDRDGGTLHLVGVTTEEVLGFLERATFALVGMNVPQTIILLEDTHHARLIRQFHPSVELISVPFSGLTKPWAWTRVMRTFSALIAKRSFSTVHLHGFLPGIFGGYFIASRNLAARVLYSPHASKSVGKARVLGISAQAILSGKCALARQIPLATCSSEARNLHTMMARPVEVVESEISAPYFEVIRREARRPLVITAGGRGDRNSVDLFAQAAVLLGGESLGVQFNWCGVVAPHLYARLRAANVALVGGSDKEMPKQLSSAWVFVETSKRPGFPQDVARAMASGVPCVVVDTPTHRDVIANDSTGFIFRTGAELARCLALLIDDSELRRRFGQAARVEADRRFAPARFRSSLWRLYGIDCAMNQGDRSTKRHKRFHERRDPDLSANSDQAALLRGSRLG